eukprot:COSAG01_NODE_71229_length_256_cov_1.095541_2_plen_40_part_01
MQDAGQAGMGWPVADCPAESPVWLCVNPCWIPAGTENSRF